MPAGPTLLLYLIVTLCSGFLGHIPRSWSWSQKRIQRQESHRNYLTGLQTYLAPGNPPPSAPMCPVHLYSSLESQKGIRRGASGNKRLLIPFVSGKMFSEQYLQMDILGPRFFAFVLLCLQGHSHSCGTQGCSRLTHLQTDPFPKWWWLAQNSSSLFLFSRLLFPYSWPLLTFCSSSCCMMTFCSRCPPLWPSLLKVC